MNVLGFGGQNNQSLRDVALGGNDIQSFNPVSEVSPANELQQKPRSLRHRMNEGYVRAKLVALRIITQGNGHSFGVDTQGEQRAAINEGRVQFVRELRQHWREWQWQRTFDEIQRKRYIVLDGLRIDLLNRTIYELVGEELARGCFDVDEIVRAVEDQLNMSILREEVVSVTNLEGEYRERSGAEEQRLVSHGTGTETEPRRVLRVVNLP